jgi:TonB family protein
MISPMSYSYPIDPLYTRFFNSTTLAIIGSFGLHALVLGVALPNWSTNSKPDTNGVSDVRVIELTEAERSRLPNLEPQIPNFSQFPDTSLTDTPLLDSSALTASLPPLSSSYPSASLPALPELPLNVYSPPVASLPPSPPQSYLPSPENITPQSLRNNTPLNSNLNQRPNFPPPSDSLNRDDITNAPLNAGDQRRAEIERQLRESGNLSPNASLPRITNPSANTGNSSPQPVVQDDRQRRLLGEVLNEAENIQAGLTRDPHNSSLAEASKNDAQWMADHNIALGKNSNQITMAGSYPRIACSKQLSGSSVYGIIVDTQGKVSGSPTLLRSSEYGVLNQQAVKDIISRSFENSTGSPKPYRVTVTFKPGVETCPGSTLAQPQEQEQEATNTRVIPPDTPTALPSPTRSVTPPNSPGNQKPQVVQPQPSPNKPNPIVEQSPQPVNRQPIIPVVEQSPQPVNRQPITPIVEQSPKPVNPQPIIPVVEQTPKPVNQQPNNTNLNLDALPTSNQPATPPVQPPSNPAVRKPNAEILPSPNPANSQKPVNPPQPIATPATKKPPTSPAETENNVSNVPSNNIIAEP